MELVIALLVPAVLAALVALEVVVVVGKDVLAVLAHALLVVIQFAQAHVTGAKAVMQLWLLVAVAVAVLVVAKQNAMAEMLVLALNTKLVVKTVMAHAIINVIIVLVAMYVMAAVLDVLVAKHVMVDAILMISNNNNSFQNIQQSYDKDYNKMLHHHSHYR